MNTEQQNKALSVLIFQFFLENKIKNILPLSFKAGVPKPFSTGGLSKKHIVSCLNQMTSFAKLYCTLPAVLGLKKSVNRWGAFKIHL